MIEVFDLGLWRFTHFFLKGVAMSLKKVLERIRGNDRKAILVLMILLVIIITTSVESCEYCVTWLRTLSDILEILGALITLWRNLESKELTTTSCISIILCKGALVIVSVKSNEVTLIVY